MKIITTFLLLLVFLPSPFQYLNAQNVGVNTPTPGAALDINGDIIIRSGELTATDGITLALDVNAVRFSYYRVTGPTADFIVAGISAAIDGRLVTLFNRSGFSMQLNNEDAAAAVTDMIVTGIGTDIIIPNKGIVNLQYDGIEQKWIVKSSNKGGAGGGGGYWDLNGAHIFNNNAGNVGIGTASPADKLTVETGNGSYGITHRSDQGNILSTRIGGSSAGIGTFSPTHMRLFCNGNNSLFISSLTNNVGIGTDDPLEKFTVQTDFNLYGISHTDGNIRLATFIGGSPIAAYVGTRSNHPLSFYANNSAGLMFIHPNGNVGIGNSAPTSPLSFSNGFGNKISFWNGGPNTDYGIGINPGVMQFYTGGFDKMAWGWGNANAFNEKMVFYTGTGELGIGTSNTAGYRLAVNGKIRSIEIVVDPPGWADYVFDKNYKLLPLDEVEKFIQQNKHLPNIPSAKEIEQNGLQVGDTQKRMIEKIEELTLYIIEQQKQIKALEQKIEKSQKKNYTNL